ncbi:MAG: energy transducer TonB [Vibrio sp.]|uniref:energy transducer TonB n=1 Tax=Vibrio sp. TaxID=678 RepID=UPI001EC5EAE0|nr:energy transducer TonB [Vibrio sp.]NRB69270.1 energy transducer TonB [Vibrio sp.]
MNLKRYAIAGGVSLALHTAVLFVADEPKLYAMPAGAQSSSVTLNFRAVSTPQPPAVAQPLPDPKPSKPVKESPPVKEKPVVKKPAPKQKKVVEKQVAQNVEKPEQKTIDKEPDVKDQQEKAKTSKPAEVNQGASREPVLIKKPSFRSPPSRPSYPRLAQKRHIEGVAMYEVWLDENGNQVKQVLISSSGATILDNSALKAIKQWEFSPNIVNGQKMAYRVRLPVRFKLD